MREVILCMQYEAEYLSGPMISTKKPEVDVTEHSQGFTVTQEIRAFSSCHLEVNWKSEGTCSLKLDNLTAQAMILNDYSET